MPFAKAGLHRTQAVGTDCVDTGVDAVGIGLSLGGRWAG